MLGCSGVGKTCLCTRYSQGTFEPNTEKTIGAAFFSRTIQLHGVTVKLEIWDTSGNERYHPLLPMYQRGASGALLIFDLTNTESFIKVPFVYESMLTCNPKAVCILVGTKCDLIHERKISTMDAQGWAEHHGIQYYEVSSSSATNIDEAFAGVTSTILQQNQQNKQNIK
uniref:Uncharacterized protein n=1 Tax=Arcella intermedia TaxID=1963864 RepID=A0A6B2LLY1_9EUKA